MPMVQQAQELRPRLVVELFIKRTMVEPDHDAIG